MTARTSPWRSPRAHADWITPTGLPEGVGALMSTRQGGVSRAPYDSLNLRPAGWRADAMDDRAHVEENQRRWRAALEAPPIYLQQVHGTRVVRLTADEGRLADDGAAAPAHDADACITTMHGVACAIQVADCLPVLYAAPGGRAVGAAHAGWRGAAGGVLEATLTSLCKAADCAPAEISVWLGPCIGPNRFEVRGDVLAAFGVSPADPSPRFTPIRDAADERWHADLAGLARDRLAAAGVTSIDGGTWCTASEASRFFSFRRDGVTGRMVAAIWRR